MAKEIERKFLALGTDWKESASSKHSIRQGYLCADRDRSVRVRVTDRNAWITIKGASQGITRDEFEYSIPLEDALELLNTLCLPNIIEKTRYRVETQGSVWEIDEFDGANAGLVVAEIELDADDRTVALPAWVGEEVSYDPRYLNVNLSQHPYSEWSRIQS